MLQKLFGFDSTQHKVRTEIVAGVTTFLTMAYILAVNPGIFSALADQGMPTNSVFTATALAAIVGTLVMAIYAKKPFGLAPSMGLNAFFTMILMPLCYSISDGIMLGSVMYVLMNICAGKKGIKKISPTMWVLFVIFVLRYIQKSL